MSFFPEKHREEWQAPARIPPPCAGGKRTVDLLPRRLPGHTCLPGYRLLPIPGRGRAHSDPHDRLGTLVRVVVGEKASRLPAASSGAVPSVLFGDGSRGWACCLPLRAVFRCDTTPSGPVPRWCTCSDAGLTSPVSTIKPTTRTEAPTVWCGRGRWSWSLIPTGYY